MSNELVFAPASYAQEQFLTSDADLTFYGGAAMSGKSYCLLGMFLKFCHHPRTRGVILRKTTKQLSNPGGLFDSAIQLYKKIDPGLKVKFRDLEIIFSSGAQLKFAYLDNPKDKYNFQGAELTFIGFDEIQQLSEDNVLYLLSRLRSTSVDYKLQAAATGNPDYDSFMRHWVEFALDERGIPIRKPVYPTRYFVRNGGTAQWSDSREELEEIYGKGEDSGILSFKFIPGNIYDNPPAMKANPGYVSFLKAQPRVEMERLLLGSWYARVEAAGHFKREWVSEVDFPNALAKKRVRSWDLAFSKPSESYPDPDWTRGVLVSKDDYKIYTVEDIASIRNRVHEVERLIFDTAKRDGKSVTISIPKDPNAAAGAYARDLQRRLGEQGYMVRLVPPVKSKLTRFAPFSSIAQSGFVHVVKAEWNKSYYDELESFNGEGKSKDDQVDATSDCIALLNQELTLPSSMSLPNLSTNAPPTFNFNQGQNIISLPTFNI